MPPKTYKQISDEQQLVRDRVNATLKGFGTGALHTPSSYMLSAMDESASKDDKAMLAMLTNFFSIPFSGLHSINEGQGKFFQNWQKGTRLATGLLGAYKGYKESSPFYKKEDEQLEEVFEDKQVHGHGVKKPGWGDRYMEGDVPEILQDIFKKLEGAGYEVPKVATTSTSKRALSPSATAGYSPSTPIGSGAPSKGLFFKEESPSSGIARHELTHYLENVAGGGTDYLSELIQQSDLKSAESMKAGSKFAERMYPGGEEYPRDVREMIARIAGASGGLDLEKRLIEQTRKSVEDITDTPSGLLGSPKTTGIHKDITEIVKDIESYNKLSQQSQNLWKNLPFEADLKTQALETIMQGKQELSEADKQKLQYIETGIPFFKEKGYIWK